MRVTVEPYGPAAFEALARAVGEAQQGDPLLRVTVVVPRGAVGLSARRRLAARPPGVLNVQFATVPVLAAELAASWLASTTRRPVTRAVLHAAVREVLATHDGASFLAGSRDEPATVRALARTYRELRGVPAPARKSVSERNARAGEVVRMVEAIEDRLAGWYDEEDLVAAAVTAVQAAPATGVGPVIAYLPHYVGFAAHALLDALAEVVPVTAIVGSTGDFVADRPGRQLARRLRHLGGDGDDPAFSTPVAQGTRVVVAPTADAEVLLAVRHLMARHRAGTPLERLALAHGGNPPYPRLLHDTLVRAGIPFNGAGIRPLSATVAGRTLLGALGLPDHDWRRDDVAGWLATAPILGQRGRLVPASAWDALSSAAGVVSGLDQWRDRLAAHETRLRARVEPDDEDDRHLLREADRSASLREFVAQLSARLTGAPRRWPDWAAWGRRLLRVVLGDASQRSDWPAAEVTALDAVHDALRGLGLLGDHQASAPEFRAALTLELESAAPQTSRFGHGILVGPVAEVVGLDLDVLWVVGVVDGAFPSPAADDVLLPDRVRQAGGPEVPLRGSRPAEDRRDCLGALAAASERVLSYASWAQRSGRAQRPARLLLDTVGALSGAGRRLFAGDLPIVDGYEQVASFAAAVASRDGEPLSVDDWDLRSLVGWVEGGGDLTDHFLGRTDRVLVSGLDLRRERQSSVFSRFDGRIDHPGAVSPAGDRVQSPTRLESFARCPRRYLFESLLGVEVRDPPETLLRISPAERGTVVHRVLERFVAGAVVEPPGPAEPWGEAGEERMRAIADHVLDEFEGRGLTGRPSLWRIDRAAILGQLRRFLREDDAYRRDEGAVPLAVEQAFGRGGDDGVNVRLADGRQVTFRGTVDRVDRTAGGGLSVLDYKTGRRRPHLEDPVGGGTQLQLPLYGLAARARYRPVGPIAVHYWYVGDRGSGGGRHPSDGFTLTDDTERRLAEVVEALVGGIEGGRFPGNPSGCTSCPYDGICPPDRVRSWERKQGDPWIAGYLALVEPS